MRLFLFSFLLENIDCHSCNRYTKNAIFMAFSKKQISFILSRLSNPITRDLARNEKVCGLFFAHLIHISRVTCS